MCDGLWYSLDVPKVLSYLRLFNFDPPRVSVMSLHLQKLYSQLSIWHALLLLRAFASYHLVRAIYLIYFSPLSIFPGSKWAALGEYWEAYWNIGVKPGHKGQTLFKLEQMHKELGGALRMRPNEVHIYDPRFYHELYRLGSKYYKDPEMHKVLGAPSSTLAESDPVRHKQRRAPLEPLFAKKNILKLEPMLMKHVDYCCKRFDKYCAAGKHVSMEWALKSLAMGGLTFVMASVPQANLYLQTWYHSLPLASLWMLWQIQPSSQCQSVSFSNTFQACTLSRPFRLSGGWTVFLYGS